MKGFLSSISLFLCGMITSVITALAVVIAAQITGFNLFTLIMWVIVPIGAILVGFAAASGYYLGSRYFQMRTGKYLLMQMVVFAGLTQLLIYYLEYIILVLDDGRHISDLVSFTQYLDISFTSAHFLVGRGFRDAGEAGSFGYWLAALQFLGMLAGGYVFYMYLEDKPICQTCNYFLLPLAKRKKLFLNRTSATPYYEALQKYPVDSDEFTSFIRSEDMADTKDGTISVTTILNACPKCNSQQIDENYKVYSGKKWIKFPKLDRSIPVPNGIDLKNAFLYPK